MFQPPNDLMNEELFVFGGKTGEQERADDMMVTKYNPKCTRDILRLNSIDDYTSHISNTQADLDSLKDLLRHDSYDLDTNDLLGVSQKFTVIDRLLSIYIDASRFLISFFSLLCPQLNKLYKTF